MPSPVCHMLHPPTPQPTHKPHITHLPARPVLELLHRHRLPRPQPPEDDACAPCQCSVWRCILVSGGRRLRGYIYIHTYIYRCYITPTTHPPTHPQHKHTYRSTPPPASPKCGSRPDQSPNAAPSSTDSPSDCYSRAASTHPEPCRCHCPPTPLEGQTTTSTTPLPHPLPPPRLLRPQRPPSEAGWRAARCGGGRRRAGAPRRRPARGWPAPRGGAGGFGA